MKVYGNNGLNRSNWTCSDEQQSGRSVEVATSSHESWTDSLIWGNRRIGAEMIVKQYTRVLELCDLDTKMIYRHPHKDQASNLFHLLEETWLHHFEPEFNWPSLKRKQTSSPTRKGFRFQPSVDKIMLNCWQHSGIHKGLFILTILNTNEQPALQWYP